MRPLPGPAARRLEGRGIHTGLPGRVEFLRRDPAEGNAGSPPRGIRFILDGGGEGGDSAERVLAPADLARLPRAARRATVLGEGAGALHTPEHLLAAMLFFADSDLDVRIAGPEVPNLDGSASPFRDALAELFPERAAAPRWREKPCGLAWEHAWTGGHIRIEPAERFSLAFELERPGLSQRTLVSTPTEAWRDVLPARTWIHLRDWEKGVAAGLLRGAEAESGLLLAGTWEEHRGAKALHADWPAGPYPLINRSAWRMEAEPVRHKVLDLLGDLALLDLSLPRAEIEVRNGGHHANHLLLERLRHG